MSHAIPKSSATYDWFFMLKLRLSLTHIKPARMIRKDNLVQIQVITCTKRSLYFDAILSAMCLWYAEHSESSPPFIEKTNGVKVPCSTFMMR